MSDIIVGVQRTLEDIGTVAKWNKKRLRWVITHNTPKQTRQHVIDLQMVLVSSQRVVLVDGHERHRAMVFGYECQFEISPLLKGAIKQDAISYELFVNGRSFTDLCKQEYAYEPPKLDVSSNLFTGKEEREEPRSAGFAPNRQQIPANPFLPKPELKKVTSLQPKPQTKPPPPSPFSLKPPPKTQDALKTAQDDLMRLMIEQKRRRKELQALSSQPPPS